MPDKVFFDSNILLYAEFNDGSKKYQTAKALLKHDILASAVHLSTQVINEFYVNALRKNKTATDIQKVLNQFYDDFNIVSVSMQTVYEAWRIFDKYQFSYWDSLIVAAALETKCSVLYTEDLSHEQIVDSSLRIINPFAGVQ
jgi:predicted nucleic acid-binding protein